MQLDLAALRKLELLCWDEWGYGTEAAQLSPEDEALLDRAAALLQTSEDQLAILLDSEDRLALPNEVTCFSPAVGPHQIEVLRM